MARINIIPSQSGPSFIDELGDFLQAVQQGKQRQAEEETQALLLGALQQPDPQAAIISALSERSANRPTGGAGFLDRLNPFTPARGQTQAGSSLIPMLAKGALGGNQTGPTQQQQFTRGVSQAKDDQKDIEDDLKHVRSAIKREEAAPSGLGKPGPDQAKITKLREVETELTRALGAARTNRRAAYGGKPSKRGPREIVAAEDAEAQNREDAKVAEAAEAESSWRATLERTKQGKGHGLGKSEFAALSKSKQATLRKWERATNTAQRTSQDEAPTTQPATQPVAQSLPGVAPGEPTATDKDGNKMVYRNGKWEPLN